MNDGLTHKGRVHQVNADGIYFETGKTLKVDRTAVRRIRLIRYVGNGRRFGKLVGGGAGLMFGLIGAAALGMEPGSNKGGKKAAVYALGIGGLPAGLLGGYYLGRAADREVTVIEVIPEPAGAPGR